MKGVDTFHFKRSHKRLKTSPADQQINISLAAVLYLRELALFINEGDDVHGFVGNHVQCVLVVRELDVLPADVLQVVFLLLQLEDMANEELLQVLVGKVDAQLFETTVKKKRCGSRELDWRK